MRIHPLLVALSLVIALGRALGGQRADPSAARVQQATMVAASLSRPTVAGDTAGRHSAAELIVGGAAVGALLGGVLGPLWAAGQCEVTVPPCRPMAPTVVVAGAAIGGFLGALIGWAMHDVRKDRR